MKEIEADIIEGIDTADKEARALGVLKTGTAPRKCIFLCAQKNLLWLVTKVMALRHHHQYHSDR